MIHPKVGVVGFGVIGRAIAKMFPFPVDSFDIGKGFYSHNTKGSFTNFNISKLPEESSKFDYLFISVPTPHVEEKGLDMSAVFDVCEKISQTKDSPIVIICSTLQPGTGDEIVQKMNLKVVIQPEYFGETIAHPLTDLSKTPFLILGGSGGDVKKVIELYQHIYNANIRIRQVSRLEAEIIKLSENRAIAFKVLQCQELYEACEAYGVDYNTIREAVYGDDPRFNLFWSFVFPENRGLNSKCLPKDLYAWNVWFKSPLTKSLLMYNETLTNCKM